MTERSQRFLSVHIVWCIFYSQLSRKSFFGCFLTPYLTHHSSWSLYSFRAVYHLKCIKNNLLCFFNYLFKVISREPLHQFDLSVDVFMEQIIARKSLMELYGIFFWGSKFMCVKPEMDLLKCMKLDSERAHRSVSDQFQWIRFPFNLVREIKRRKDARSTILHNSMSVFFLDRIHRALQLSLT